MKNKMVGGLFLASCYTPPSMCDVEQATQTGLYTMVLEEASGDCGPVGEIEIELNNGIPFLDSASGCTLEKYEWTQEECYSETSFYCRDDFWYMELDWLVVSNESDPDVLNGSLVTYMARTTGFYSCESEYSFKATK